MPAKITKETFIRKASIKHNNKYNYNKVIYQPLIFFKGYNECFKLSKDNI